MASVRYHFWVVAGGLAGALAVLAAAAAAHLPGDAAQSRAMASAVQMHGWHALALVLCGAWGARGGWLAHAAGGAFAAGILLFCGTIYAGALGVLQAGRLAPVGGTLLIAGWVLLGLSGLRRRPGRDDGW